MNDPHVEALYYRVVAGENVDYDKAPPVSVDTAEFKLSLEPKTATFTMKKHYSTEDEAKAVVNMYLQAWVILIGLENGPDELHFVFDHASIIDRAPQQSEKDVISLQARVTNTIAVTCNAILQMSRGSFPSFPKNFVASDEAEMMYFKYKKHRQGHESLASLGYWCLTILEASAGGPKSKEKNKRKRAAKKYCIEVSVLKTLGRLSSTKGGITEARKFPEDGQLKPFSPEEREWLVSVVKALIRRAGEYVYSGGAKLKQLRMKDFPQMTS